MKTIIKLAISALIVNGAWRLGSEYVTLYAFRDAVREAALAKGLSEDRLRERIMELAAARGLPLSEDQVTIRREERHAFVSGSYVKPVALFPGIPYDWQFEWEVDGFIVTPPIMEVLPRQSSPQ